MSYRNDHDAALARIDSLEQELEQAKAAATVAATPVPKPNHVWRTALIATLGAGVLAGGWLWQRPHHKQAELAVPMAPVIAEPISIASLAPCLERVRAAPDAKLDAVSTDPHGAAHSIFGIEHVGASCRGDLAALVDQPGLTTAERAALQRWLAAENALAGDISRIVTYYGNDPYRLDGYTTAPQLWREYTTDRAARDAALPALELQPTS